MRKYPNSDSSDDMIAKPMHSWIQMRGSNTTYKCERCGVLGHTNIYRLDYEIIPINHGNCLDEMTKRIMES